MARKKIKKNRYKKAKKTGVFNLQFPAVLKMITGFLALVIMSAAFIFCHDYIMRPSFFKTVRITVSGNQRLPDSVILKESGIFKGINILDVNLKIARKKLIRHPWVKDAEVIREVPDGFHIKITEHRASAVIDLGHRYLLDENGVIFKKNKPSDPDRLPLVKGLRYSDIKIFPPAYGLENTKYEKTKKSEEQTLQVMKAMQDPFDAVIEVLRLGRTTGCILPNKIIKRIDVDRQTGLTLELKKNIRTVKLGYHHYLKKYAVLKKVITTVTHGGINGIDKIESIDLNNLDRIVIKPVRKRESKKT